MCGRFTLFTDPATLHDAFDIPTDRTPTIQPRYNIAPSQNILTIIKDNHNQQHRIGYMTWGLIPAFLQKSTSSYSMINARQETLLKKASFKRLLPARRCVIPASGFYEWHEHMAKPRDPYFIQRTDQKPMWFAGLWDKWEKNEQKIFSCTIITTQATNNMNTLHHRMPVILSHERALLWLDRDYQDSNILTDILSHNDIDVMMHKISTDVGNVRHDDPSLLQPVP